MATARRKNSTTEPPPATPAQTPRSRARRRSSANGATNGATNGTHAATATPVVVAPTPIISDPFSASPAPTAAPTNGHAYTATPAPAPAAPTVAVAPPVEVMPPAGVDINQVTAAVLVSALDGVPAAKGVAAELPHGASHDVVLYILPEDWRDDAARSFLQGLTDDQAGLLLAWLTRQWWEGYGLGNLHGRAGEDMRAIRG